MSTERVFLLPLVLTVFIANGDTVPSVVSCQLICNNLLITDKQNPLFSYQVHSNKLNFDCTGKLKYMQSNPKASKKRNTYTTQLSNKR